MNTKELTIMSLVAIALVASFAWYVSGVLDRSEIVECNQWKTQSTQYAGFFLSQWQAEQCQAHDITINAPIK